MTSQQVARAPVSRSRLYWSLFRVYLQINYFHFFFIPIWYSDYKTEEIFQKYQFKKISKPFFDFGRFRTEFLIKSNIFSYSTI